MIGRINLMPRRKRAEQKALEAYKRYQEADTDEDRVAAVEDMIAWHRESQIELAYDISALMITKVVEA